MPTFTALIEEFVGLAPDETIGYVATCIFGLAILREFTYFLRSLIDKI